MKKIIIIIFAMAVIYGLSLHPYIDGGGDDAGYIILARSIVSGQGYTNIEFPQPTPHALYPPFFPLMLSALMVFFGENVLILKLIPLFSSLACVYVLWLIFKEDANKNYFWAIGLFALSPLTLIFGTEVLTEAPCILASYLALFFLIQYDKQRSLMNRYLFFSLLMMLAAFYIRTAGIVVFGAGFLFLLYRRRIKITLFISSVYAVCILPWIIRNISVGSIYAKVILRSDVMQADAGSLGISGLIQRVSHNLIVYSGKLMAEIFFYPYFDDVTKLHKFFVIKIILSVILSLLIFYGCLCRLKKGLRVIDFYFGLLIVMLILYPFSSTRHIWSIFPLLLLFFFEGIERALKTRGRVLICILVGIFLSASLYADIKHIHKVQINPYSAEEQDYLAAVEWVKENSPSESIIMCRKPRIAFFYSNRRAMFYPSTLDTKKTLKTVKDDGVDYVIFDTLGIKDAAFGMWKADKFLKPLLRDYPEHFSLIHSIDDSGTAVYKVKKDQL